MEIWRDITGYEGLYKISSLGRVMSVKRNKILKPGNTGKYLIVVLCKNGVRNTHLVHRLVAFEFCIKQPGQCEVNHLNEIKTDYRAENLEWCTRLENIRYGTGIERHSTTQKNDHRSKAVFQYSLDGKLVRQFPSVGEIVRTYGYDKGFIIRCLQGKRPTAYGYLWQFAT